ncbi:MAG: FHA domain-containing protein [Verrucomicrobiaceae bacterium]|nr:MAG: FHA domain-containing protein [Verrucomicrobiaceae bacterium]
MAVSLSVTKGPAKGKVFTFTEHDTFLFGRMPDCHATFPDDTQVSRHHFILEACPPKASLRDLGSLNGTYVNGKKYGARKAGESPEEGAKRQYPTVDLKNGDIIEVGKTTISVAIAKQVGHDAVNAGIQPGELSELSPDQLFQLVFGGEKNPGLIEIPGFVAEKELGRGGFGAVYQARRKKDGSRVAIKVMLSEVDATEDAVLRFKREMEVNRQLDHPNIVRFIESGSHKGAFYFVMELCDGGSLMDLYNKNRGPLTQEQLMPHALKALEGLAFAHSKGFVHRDLKPGNILIHKGIARVADFGMSKSFQMAGLSGMSMTGKTAGTPVFMPPEQIINFKYVKPVSDVFSMGATLYFLLTGKFPFEFQAKRDPMDVILNDDVVPIRKRLATIPKPLAIVIDRAVTKKHKDRYSDAAELLKALK